MVKPGYVSTDPRDPDAPIRMDEKRLDRARSRMTLQELLAIPGNAEFARRPVKSEPLDLPEIPPERLAELRERRDYLLALLRERWNDGRE